MHVVLELTGQGFPCSPTVLGKCESTVHGGVVSTSKHTRPLLHALKFYVVPDRREPESILIQEISRKILILI